MANQLANMFRIVVLALFAVGPSFELALCSDGLQREQVLERSSHETELVCPGLAAVAVVNDKVIFLARPPGAATTTLSIVDLDSPDTILYRTDSVQGVFFSSGGQPCLFANTYDPNGYWSARAIDLTGKLLFRADELKSALLPSPTGLLFCSQCEDDECGGSLLVLDRRGSEIYQITERMVEWSVMWLTDSLLIWADRDSVNLVYPFRHLCKKIAAITDGVSINRPNLLSLGVTDQVLVVSDHLHEGYRNDHLHVIDTKDGEVWRTSVDGVLESVAGSPGDGSVAVIVKRAAAHSLEMRDSRTGEIRWNVPLDTLESSLVGMPFRLETDSGSVSIMSPCDKDQGLIPLTANLTTRVYTFESKTGNFVTSTTLPGLTLKWHSSVTGMTRMLRWSVTKPDVLTISDL